MRTLHVIFVTLLSGTLLFTGAETSWAQGGRITGQVTEGQTSQPLVGAQVSIDGTGIGTVTNQEGRFLLIDVPAGTHTVVAQLIGYGTERANVTVAAAEVAVANFQMTSQAIQLEGIVATGTAIRARQRELGNSVGLITSQEIEQAAVTNIADVLRGRVPGLQVLGNAGQVGAGARISLRGINSLERGNRPLIYVDGIRIGGGPHETNTEAGQSATILADLNPANIARIEIIRGAAATTLYGTQASSGVIQIFTKTGQDAGADPRWAFATEQGFLQMGHVGPESDPTGLHLNDCSMDPGCPASGSWFRTGHLQEYRASLRGGEDVTYFVAGNMRLQEGVVAPQDAQDFSLRANFRMQPLDALSIRLNTFYAQRKIRWIPNGDQDEGFFYNVTRLDQGETPDNNDALVLDMDLEQRIEHYVVGTNIDWTPVAGFQQRLNLGVDLSNSSYATTRPFGFYTQEEGDRELEIERRRLITVDYAGSWNQPLPADFSSTFSWGGQYYATFQLGLEGYGRGFAGPGDKLVDSGVEEQTAEENRDVVHSSGLFVQEQIGWRNRLFLTAGLRADTHSSFGADYNLNQVFTYYPKLQATYTFSDHGFWPEWWQTFRLRAAYGESGQAPDAEAPLRYFEPAGADEAQPAYIIFNQGNSEIGPERSREYEVGFDGAMFDRRVSYRFTYYDQKTLDGIVSIDPPYSNGIAETVPVNIGEWVNTGIEASLNLLAYQGDDVTWNLAARYSKNDSEMVEFGLEADQGYGLQYQGQEYRVGYPMPSFFGEVVTNPDAAGVLPEFADSTTFFGQLFPPVSYSIGTTLTFFDRLTLNVFGLGKRGHVAIPDMAQELAEQGVWPVCQDINEQVSTYFEGSEDPAALAGLTAGQIAHCSEQYADNPQWVEPADYFRLASASLNYRIPTDWLPAGISSSVVSFEAGNLYTFTDFSGVDPAGFTESADLIARNAGYTIPAPHSYVLSAQVTF